MTGLLLFLGVIVLLVVALEVTHRRAGASWRPGLDTRRDRDLDRVAEDLRDASQREQPAPTPPELGSLSQQRLAREAIRFSRLAA
jgi:hypothetical protein